MVFTLNAASSDAVGDANSIAGKRIALAGRFGGMNRREAANLLRSYQATVVELTSPQIDWLVIGADESPLAESELLDPETQQRIRSGTLEVVQESELWQRLGLVDLQRSTVKSLYTPAMLADLLGVSVRVIRRWHRRGLIVPVRTLHKLPYFDFQEIATARRLAELVAAGASAQAIEKRLRELATLLPDVERPLAQLSVLIEGRHVLLRQGEGLIEPGGQLRFDFDDPASPGTNPEDSPSTVLFQFPPPDANSLLQEEDELLSQVYWAEDQGDLQTAIDLCHAIMARDGIRSDICFQLGELLYRDGQIEAARERYYAAIELDEGFIEARTNLGCVLAETGRHELAIAAFQGVLSLHEDCPDAHFHLADSLSAIGELEQAAVHRERYRQLAPSSPWADTSDSLPSSVAEPS